MKLRSAPILGCGMFFMTLAMDTRCDFKDVAGGGLLDGLWFAAAVTASNQGDSRLQDQIDELSGQIDDLSGHAQPGKPGQACWDLNGNGRADPGEDVNGDGIWDVQDCQGAAGTAGQEGSPGGNCWDTIGDYNGDHWADAQDCLDWVAAHVDAQAGARGADGANCWDTIGDYNHDGVKNGQDCLDWVANQVAAGPAGPAGPAGGNCWDDIGDFNGDGHLNSYDCLDYVSAGGESAVIARAFVDAFGVVHRGSNIVDASFISAGDYEIVVSLAESQADLTDPGLSPLDFPVLITIYATSADPLPWSENIAALVGHYKFDDATSLNRTDKTLTLRVYILDAQTGKHSA